MKSSTIFSIFMVPLTFLTNFMVRYFWQPLQAGTTYNISAFHLRRGGTRRLLHGFLVVFALAGLPNTVLADNNSVNGSCPGEVIEEIDGKSTDAWCNRRGWK